MMPAIGTNRITRALARPRSWSGNQLPTMVSTTGSMPPSATPSAKRRISSSVSLRTRPVSTEMMAQASIDQAMKLRPLPRTASLPPGICRNR
ncbi:hypothetical protein D3C72_1687170 [compost metagenome]